MPIMLQRKDGSVKIFANAEHLAAFFLSRDLPEKKKYTLRNLNREQKKAKDLLKKIPDELKIMKNTIKEKTCERKNRITTFPVFEALAGCALPLIRRFCATEKGRRAYEEWEKNRESH